MTGQSSWCGRDRFVPLEEVPEHVDMNGLLISFTLDGVEVPGRSGGMLAWMDMKAAPAVGDLVMLRALRVDDPGVAIVRARAWFEHNWLVLYLKRVGTAAEDVAEDG